MFEASNSPLRVQRRASGRAGRKRLPTYSCCSGGMKRRFRPKAAMLLVVWHGGRLVVVIEIGGGRDEDDGPASRRTSGSRETGKQLTPIAYLLGVALIVLYFVGLALAWSNIGGSDSDWGRRLQLLAGVEALAFAAAGAILCTTVQRQRRRKSRSAPFAPSRRRKRTRSKREKGRPYSIWRQREPACRFNPTMGLTPRGIRSSRVAFEPATTLRKRFRSCWRLRINTRSAAKATSQSTYGRRAFES